MGINVNPANLNQVVQTTVNQAVRTIEEENLFDGQNSANNTNETNSSIGTDIVNVVTELLPSLVSTLVNTILEQLGLKQKPSEPQQPAQPVAPESPKGIIEELESQKAQLEADKAVAEQEYVEALNNRTLMFTFTSSANAQTDKKEELTYKNFTSDLNTEKYRLVDPASGKILCTDRSEATRYVDINDYATFDADGNQTGWKEGQSQDTYNAACEEFYQKNMLKLPALNNKNYLQDAIQAGTIAIERQTFENINVPVINQKTGQQEINDDGTLKFASKANISWDAVSLAGMDDVSSELYTADDNAATAKYEASVLRIEAEIKKIDMQIALEKAETPEIKELELQKLEILESNQKASEEYVEALNNRHLMLSVLSSPNAQSTTKVELTYENLTSGLNGSQLYRLVDTQTGKVVVTTHYEAMEQMFMENESVVMPELKDPKVLQKALQDGTLSIQKSNVELGFESPNAPEKTIIQTWETIELSSMPDVSSELYTDDDNAAMAKYETTVLKNQAKMKEIEVKIAEAKTKYYEEQKAANETQKETEIQEPVVQKDYTTRQIERYEKYIEKYEKEIEELEKSNDPNKDAKIASLMEKIEKYMNKINQLID